MYGWQPTSDQLQTGDLERSQKKRPKGESIYKSRWEKIACKSTKDSGERIQGAKENLTLDPWGIELRKQSKSLFFFALKKLIFF